MLSVPVNLSFPLFLAAFSTLEKKARFKNFRPYHPLTPDFPDCLKRSVSICILLSLGIYFYIQQLSAQLSSPHKITPLPTSGFNHSFPSYQQREKTFIMIFFFFLLLNLVLSWIFPQPALSKASKRRQLTGAVCSSKGTGCFRAVRQNQIFPLN